MQLLCRVEDVEGGSERAERYEWHNIVEYWEDIGLSGLKKSAQGTRTSLLPNSDHYYKVFYLVKRKYYTSN